MQSLLRSLARHGLPAVLLLTTLSSLISCKTDEELKELEEIAGSAPIGERKERFSRTVPSDTMKVAESGGSSFYLQYPAGQRPNRVLEKDTRVRLIKDRGTYSVVKLTSGQQGFVRTKSLERTNEGPLEEPEAADQANSGSDQEPGSELESDGSGLPMNPSTYPSTPNTEAASSPSPGTPDAAGTKVETEDALSESIKRLYREREGENE